MFVDLTEAGELRPYAALLPGLRPHDDDLTHDRLAIRDVSVPTVARMREIQAVIQGALAANRPVYVHCWGGTGRTGTAVGCWLVGRGLADEDPIAVLKSLRARCGKARRRSPDTDEQAAFVRRWSAAGGTGGASTAAKPGRAGSA